MGNLFSPAFQLQSNLDLNFFADFELWRIPIISCCLILHKINEHDVMKKKHHYMKAWKSNYQALWRNMNITIRLHKSGSCEVPRHRRMCVNWLLLSKQLQPCCSAIWLSGTTAHHYFLWLSVLPLTLCLMRCPVASVHCQCRVASNAVRVGWGGAGWRADAIGVYAAARALKTLHSPPGF